MKLTEELEALRTAFLESLRVRGQARATRESRSEAFTTFFGWLAGQGVDDVRAVGGEHVRAYLRWLVENPAFTTATVHVKLGGVRRLFEWLEATDALLLNPCAGVRLPRLADRLPRGVLTQAEARRVLEAPDTQTKMGIRDRAILELFYATGIRGEEMAGLTIHDVDPRAGFVRVTKGKFAKDRVVPMGTTAGDYLREYLVKVRLPWSQHQKDERALWLAATWPHGRLTKQAIAVMVKNYKRLAGIERPGATHLWRHTCATHMVQNGANLLYVQRLLGHRSLDTTAIYTRVAVPELVAMIRKAHPPIRPPPPPMTALAQIERYRSHMAIRNYSVNTISKQCSSLNLLLRFLGEIGQDDLAVLTTATLRDFQRWHFYQPTRRGTARGIPTQNRVLAAVKGLFKCLLADGLIARDPAAELEYGREPQRLPRNILTPQEARRIIEAPDVKTVLGYRDRTILEVFYATGIRKSELMGLELPDVNLDEELLRINGGKGAKDRVVPLTAAACTFLETYIKAIRLQLLGAKTSPRLFLSGRGRPIARNTLGQLVVKYAPRARIKKRVTCHLWRHTCATHLLQNRANLRHVQELLGHRCLSTTERYLHLTITELKEAHRRHHPREKARPAD